jgi:hypothetical protein
MVYRFSMDIMQKVMGLGEEGERLVGNKGGKDKEGRVVGEKEKK